MTTLSEDLKAKIDSRYARIGVLHREIEQKHATIEGLQNEITELMVLLAKEQRNDRNRNAGTQPPSN